MIRSKSLADAAHSVYSEGNAFLYDRVLRDKVVTFSKGTDTMLNIKVNSQRRSMKGLLLLLVEPYPADTRNSE